MGEDDPIVRFILLRDAMQEIRIMETRLEELANLDNAEVLRECADALQAVRQHYWPAWMKETNEAARREQEEAGGDG